MKILRIFLVLTVFLGGVAKASPFSVDHIVVKKGDRKMFLFNEGRLVKSYPISLGDNPIGHKVQVGDERTPEGRYNLTYKNPESRFYRSIHVDYPNVEDRKRAKDLGVHPGGQIKIHGLPNRQDFPTDVYLDMNWTDGCIAVSNKHMDELWSSVKFNTPIEILP